MDIYVGNLAFTATADDLSELFSPFGAVESIKLINDRETGRFRGFAFVAMTNRDEALTALAELNGRDLLGRELRLREAAERPAFNGGDRGAPRGPSSGGERRPNSGFSPRPSNNASTGAPRSFTNAPRPAETPRPSNGGGEPDRSSFRNDRPSRGDKGNHDRGEKGGFRGERPEKSGRGAPRQERRGAIRHTEDDDDDF